MKLRKLIVSVASLLSAMHAHGAENLKIGLVLPLSGPFSAYGKQMKNGVDVFLKQNGNVIAGRKVELIVKDDGGVQPELAKQVVIDLAVKENVDILAGFCMTPSALAGAPVATEAKKPMVVMNAATSIIPSKGPYILRTSHTLPQLTAPIAMWAQKNGIKSAYTLVADFGPGIDAEKQFIKSFTAAGGAIVDSARIPVKNPDLSPFLQRIKDKKPEAVFIFLPPGEQTISFVKGYQERGLDKLGIKLIGTVDLTDDDTIGSLGSASIGIITAGHYSFMHNSPENKAYTDTYMKLFPKDRPNYMSVAAYDGMQLVAEALKVTGGDASAQKFVEAAKGVRLNSPRGSIAIDPATRDIVQTVYIRRVEKVGNSLVNVEFDDSFKEFRNPEATPRK